MEEGVNKGVAEKGEEKGSVIRVVSNFRLFHDEGSYHIETSPLICRANQSTGFYMIGTSVMKELS